MLILISPAKKLKNTQKELKNLTNIEFPEESKELVSELEKYKPQDLSSLMKISPKLGELNFERFVNWQYPFKSKDAGPALFMFNGDVYRGMNTGDFSEEDILFAQKHLRILSGLYGIIKPADQIMPYRLEMGTKLKTKKGKNLYEFWGDKITEKINLHLKQQEDNYVINLASNEYFKAVKPEKLNAEIITPVFKEQKEDSFKVVAIHAKRARGLMCRYIIKNKIKNIEDLKGFDYERYSFNHSLSSEKEFVFTR